MENKGFQQNPNNRYDTEMRLRAVEGGVASHNDKMADEERLAIPAYDESVVSDYIRNRVEPPKDIVEGRKIFKVETIKQPERDYEKDFKKLRKLTSHELDKLLTEIESKSKEGRRLFSSGNLLNGYAIDPKTLNSLRTTHHDGVKEDLVLDILFKMGIENINEDTELLLKKRVITGIVFLEVPGFKTPIVKLLCLGSEEMGDLVPKEDIERIASYLKHERKLLPISSDFKVL